MEIADKNVRVPQSLLDRINALCSADAKKKGKTRPTVQWVLLAELIKEKEEKTHEG